MSRQTNWEREIPALNQLRAEIGRVAAADAKARRSQPVRPLVVGLAVILFAAVGTTFAFIRTASEPSLDRSEASRSQRPATEPEEGAATSTPPAPAGFDAHGIVYEDVSALIRASDLILIGTVEETRVAKVIGEGPEDEFPTRILHTAIAVEEALRGSDSVSKVVVTTDELAYRGPGISDWREPGRRILLFLTPSPDPNEPDVHVPTGLAYFQTAYFTDGEEIEMTVGGDLTGLSQRIAAMRIPELRDRARTVGP